MKHLIYTYEKINLNWFPCEAAADHLPTQGFSLTFLWTTLLQDGRRCRGQGRLWTRTVSRVRRPRDAHARPPAAPCARVRLRSGPEPCSGRLHGLLLTTESPACAPAQGTPLSTEPLQQVEKTEHLKKINIKLPPVITSDEAHLIKVYAASSNLII